MGNTLRDPDFVTDRGPLIDYGDGVFDVGDPVQYSMAADINEHYPTDGSPRTFNSVARVKAGDKFNFVKSILADVYEDTANEDTGQVLVMTPYGATSAVGYYRNPLVRLHPQRHPIHPRAFAVDAAVVAGEGFPTKSGEGELTFKTRNRVGSEADTDDGFVRIGITWRDLPYEVNIEDSQTNNPFDSEIRRYCVFKPAIKGNNLHVKGNVFYVDDDGTIILNSGSSTPFTVPEPSTFPVPAATYSVTIKMVPRVPIAAQLMQGMCNQTNTIQFPSEILKEIPDVGTLTYLGYELSDPYYTVSGRKVFDITYSLGHRPSGDGPKRGWNAGFCPQQMGFRRIIVARLVSGTPNRFYNTVTGAEITTFPISNDSIEDQSIRLARKGENVYNFAELANLFKFEGEQIV